MATLLVEMNKMEKLILLTSCMSLASFLKDLRKQKATRADPQ